MTSKAGRSIQPTERGRDYNIQVKQKEYKRLLQRLRKDANDLLPDGGTPSASAALDERATLRLVQSWKHEYVTFLQVHEDLKPLLSPEELEKQQALHNEVLTEVNRLRSRLDALEVNVTTAGRAKDTRSDRMDDGKSVAGSIRSGSSRRSTSSSVRARLTAMQVDDERQRAEAAVRMAALQRKRQLDKQRQELEWQEEELRLQTQMDVHKAQSEVISQFENEIGDEPGGPDNREYPVLQPSGDVNDGLHGEGKDLPVGQHLQPFHANLEQPVERDDVAAERATTSHTNTQRAVSNAKVDTGKTSEELLAGLSTLLSEQNKRSALPALEPEVFKGSIENFQLWLKSFESYIESRTTSPVERLHYLTRYTGGDARNAIQGLVQLRTEDAYDRAKAKLMDRYGSSFVTVAAYKRRLRDWPPIKPGDSKGLLQLADFLDGCEATSDTIPGLKVLGEAEESSIILRKLPKYLVDRWKRVVDSRIYEPDPGQRSRYPTFAEFVKFINREARIATGPVTVHAEENVDSDQRHPRSHPGRGRASTFLASSHVPETLSSPRSRLGGRQGEYSAPKCVLCPERHLTGRCAVFQRMSVAERHETVKKHGLCRGCLRSGHLWRVCRRKETCEQCGKLHPSLLHDESLVSGQRDTEVKKLVQNEATQTATSLQVTAEPTSSPCSHSLIVPVKLWHRRFPEHHLVTYAILDPQSDACFLKNSVGEELHAVGEPVCLDLSTMTGKVPIKTSAVKDLVIQSLETGSEIDMPTAYTREDIAVDRQLIPRKESVDDWEHLQEVAAKLPAYHAEADIGLLIGFNCARAIRPKEVVTGGEHDPWAVRTELGWGVIGTMKGERKEATACFLVNMGNGSSTVCHYAFKTHVKEISPEQVSRLFDHDFMEMSKDAKTSQEDVRFKNLMETELRQQEDGHFVAPLPLKDPDFNFPNNRTMVVQRLNSLKRRMLSDSQFRQDYESYMKDMLDKGHAEMVPEDELQRKDGKLWYVAHHGVYRRKKEKIRVVFDCSGEYKNQSLNDQLMQGPDVSNNLAGILTRFRKGPVAVTCDVQGMFNQVMVSPRHRDLLRFVWWKDGNLDQEPTEYRMTTHLFGATSSPACAMSALNKTADEYEDRFGSDAANFIRRDFYVDDGLTSTTEPTKAVQLVDNTIKMCASGGFQLHKFTSNCAEVVAGIPVARCSKSLEHVDIADQAIVEQALGIRWNLRDDCFLMNTRLPDRPATRRGILSAVSSLYDPLGWVSPFTLLGKNILKQLCCDGYEWDDHVPDDIVTNWTEWKSDLEMMSQLTIPRCYTPPDFNRTDCECELHHFSDASLCGYGECSYLRIVDRDGRVSVSLVMSKSRVTPKRPMTIPRLELAAALTAVKASTFLRSELCLPNLKEYFWTDSMAVLGYIQNDNKRFHVFVANRVQQIRQSSSATQWRYVASADNPADLASRGVRAESLMTSVLWWMGPSFLRNTGSLPEEKIDVDVSPEDPEVKATSFQVTTNHVADPKGTPLSERLAYFSSWTSAKRAVAICLRYRERLLQRVRSRRTSEPRQIASGEQKSAFKPVSVEEMQEAERVVLIAVQMESYGTELALAVSTSSSATPKKSGHLQRLNPYVGTDGLLRVGGRLRRSHLPLEVIHPVILPKHGHVTKLIISHVHEKLQHPGRETTLSEIRHIGIWIVRGRSAVSKFILNCVKCRRLRGTPCGQKMADLPTARTEVSEPFEFSGVDAFGPFFIRERRSEVKRWGLIFTCLASRAVHLETINSLTADSFLNAYRRFVCRRGPIRRLYCDNGTNFIGGKRMLESALKEEDHDKIKRQLIRDDCDWVEFALNVPHASHMGGVWERQIRTARSALTSLLDSNGQHLDDELLRTLLTEAEAIVNSRPLTYCSMSCTDTVEPITPLQLLTLKSKVVLPSPGQFCKEDLYGRRRWRRVQHLANEFWTRWRSEFLPTLQERRKWTAVEPNLEVGDLVLTVDDQTPRSRWPVGRITDTYPSQDGLVRKVQVQIGGSKYDRPVHRLIVLMKGRDSQSGEL